ncbi:MAG: hypothetical protein ACR2F2_09220 [Pyrinomonadaceae bacterium]
MKIELKKLSLHYLVAIIMLSLLLPITALSQKDEKSKQEKKVAKQIEKDEKRVEKQVRKYEETLAKATEKYN